MLLLFSGAQNKLVCFASLLKLCALCTLGQKQTQNYLNINKKLLLIAINWYFLYHIKTNVKSKFLWWILILNITKDFILDAYYIDSNHMEMDIQLISVESLTYFLRKLFWLWKYVSVNICIEFALVCIASQASMPKQ